MTAVGDFARTCSSLLVFAAWDFPHCQGPSSVTRTIVNMQERGIKRESSGGLGMESMLDSGARNQKLCGQIWLCCQNRRLSYGVCRSGPPP